MIFAHGNKSIAVVCFFILMILASLCMQKIYEIKIELKKNMHEYEIVTSRLEESNRNVVKESGL